MDYAVITTGLTKSFGQLKALDSIDLHVPKNTIYGIVGPNGAGKTTLFSLIAGFLQADAGSISILGYENRSKILGRMSILPQDARFQSSIPIPEQLMFFLMLGGASRSEALQEIQRVLEIVDFGNLMEKAPASLSHGQYKRLALAQAFVGKPDLIILDEPTTGLDQASAKSVRAYIHKLKQDATIIVSSHDMAEMYDLCDHYAVLNRGRLVESGELQQLQASDARFLATLTRTLETTVQKTLAMAIEQEIPGAAVSWLAPDSLEVALGSQPRDAELVSSTILSILLANKAGLKECSWANPLERVYTKQY